MARESVVHVRATDEQRDVALAWLRAEHGDTLGTILVIEDGTSPAVAVDGDRFELSCDGIELVGDTMADRACCKMPFHVWYEPMQPVEKRLVGCPDVFRVDDPHLGWFIDRPNENNAFFGSF